MGTRFLSEILSRDMDSGNSGSTQSSSGGEEEYESSSRGGAGADSFPALFHHHQNHQAFPPAGHVTLGPFSTNPPVTTPNYFDPLASYFDHLSRSPGSSNPNPLLNLDPVWSKDIMRSDPLMGASTSSSNNDNSSFQPLHPQPQLVRGSAPSSSATDHLANQSAGGSSGGGGAGRNPKKRTRASRRAPTTVLTTDTSNFRAMVQEFTGIPAPPFGSSASSSSLLFPRTRLDLFGNRGGGSNPLLMDPPAPPFPPYLLRPFAQKIPVPPTPPPVSLPFASSTSTSHSTTTTTTAITTTTTTTTTTTNSDIIAASSRNFQIPPSDLGLLTTMPNNLYFPSLLDPPRKYPSSNPDPGSSKPSSGGSLELPLTTSNDNRSQLRMGLMGHEFSHDHDQLNGLTASLLTTTAASSNSKNNPLGWAEGLGLGADAAPAGSRSGNGGNADHSHHRRLGSGTPVGDFSKDSGATPVEAWICSSTDRLA